MIYIIISTELITEQSPAGNVSQTAPKAENLFQTRFQGVIYMLPKIAFGTRTLIFGHF